MSDQPLRDVDDRLADLVDGRMTPRERERFEAELRVNPQLRADLADYRRTVAVLRAALQEPVAAAAAKSMADRVLAAITVAPSAGPPVRSRWSWGRGVAAVAGAAALLALAFWLDAAPVPPVKTESTARQDATGPAGDAPAATAAVEAEHDAANLRLAMPDAAPPAAAGGGSEADAGTPPPGPVPKATARARGAGGQAPAERGEPTANAPAEAPGGRKTLEPFVADGKERELGGGGAWLRGQAAPAEGAVQPIPVLTIEDRESASPVNRESRRRDGSGDGKAAASGPGARSAGGAEARAKSGGTQGALGPLDGPDLRAALDVFVEQLGSSAEPIAAHWPTPRGDLRASPLLEEALATVLRQGAPPAAGGRSGEPSLREEFAIDRGWLVEGARADVELLLQRVAAAAAARDWALRPGEAQANQALLAAPMPSASPIQRGDEPAGVEAPIRLLLRLRLRAR